MSLTKTRTCRFCECAAPAVLLVRFGARQYAHPACGLDRLGQAFLAVLEPNQLGKIPVGLAHQYRVLGSIERRLAEVGA